MVLSRKAALMTNVILFTAGEVFLSILSLLFLEMAAWGQTLKSLQQ